MRNVNKAIQEYRRIIKANERIDFSLPEFCELKNMSNNIWDTITNAAMFGFAIGYRCACKERERCDHE